MIFHHLHDGLLIHKESMSASPPSCCMLMKMDEQRVEKITSESGGEKRGKDRDASVEVKKITNARWPQGMPESVIPEQEIIITSCLANVRMNCL